MLSSYCPQVRKRIYSTLSKQTVDWLSDRRELSRAGFFYSTSEYRSPLLLNALTGKGLQADSTGSANTMSVYVPDTTNGHGMINPYPYTSPPFFETWNNPVEKKKGKGITARQKQPIQFNSSSRNNTIRLIKKKHCQIWSYCTGSNNWE